MSSTSLRIGGKMDTEKLKDLLLTEKEIDSAFRSYPQLKPCGTTLYCCIMDILRAQILKLQQAGWGNLKEQQKHIELLESENYAYQDKESELQVRIKELEKQNEQLRIGELVITTEQKQKEQIKAEARQQAQGELSGWIRCPHCGSGAIIWGKDRILLECTNCGNKLQELPKE